jgi:hypothetical protein
MLVKMIKESIHGYFIFTIQEQTEIIMNSIYILEFWKNFIVVKAKMEPYNGIQNAKACKNFQSNMYA